MLDVCVLFLRTRRTVTHAVVLWHWLSMIKCAFNKASWLKFGIFYFINFLKIFIVLIFLGSEISILLLQLVNQLSVIAAITKPYYEISVHKFSKSQKSTLKSTKKNHIKQSYNIISSYIYEISGADKNCLLCIIVH